MILNGERITRINSLRIPGVFDFVSFWEQRNEFIELVTSLGNLNKDFFNTEEEQMLGSVVCNFLDDNLLYAKFTSYIENSKLLIPRGSHIHGTYHEKSITLGATLAEKYIQLQQEIPNNRKFAVGLIALYKMLGKEFESRLDVHQCLGVLGKVDAIGTCIFLANGIRLAMIEEIAYPLSTKPIVNLSNEKVQIEAGEQTIELDTGECVIGVFHQDKCYKLLPSKGKNDNTELYFRFDQRTQCTCLHIADKRVNEIEVIENVASFFIDRYGYAYVMENGEVRISDRDKFSMYPLSSRLSTFLRFNQDKEIIEITCRNEDDYDILCKTI